MSDLPSDPLDDRVRAYFRERGAGPIPRDLMEGARERIAMGRPAWSNRRFLPRFNAIRAALAVVVALVVVIGASRLWPPNAAVTSAPSASNAQPSAVSVTSSPSEAGSPVPATPAAKTALGLPILSVSAAIEVMAAGTLNGRAIAVGGFWADPGPVPCPGPMDPPTGLEGICSLSALMETDQHLGTENGYGGSWRKPGTPFLRPLELETAGFESLSADGSGGSPHGFLTPNRQVVVVGHTDDPRKFGCAPASVDACAQGFVVDRIVEVDGKPVEARWWDPLRIEVAMTPEAAIAAALTALPAGSTVLTIARLAASQAPTMDPRLDVGVSGIVWVARALVGAPAADRTAQVQEAVVDDATGIVIRTLPLAIASDYRPGSVVLHTQVPSGPDRNPPGSGGGGTPFVGVSVPGGIRTLLGEPGLVVLDPGDHVLRAWRASLTGFFPPGQPPEQGKPRDECSLDIQMAAVQRLSYTATWGATGPCTWSQTPTP